MLVDRPYASMDWEGCLEMRRGCLWPSEAEIDPKTIAGDSWWHWALRPQERFQSIVVLRASELHAFYPKKSFHHVAAEAWICVKRTIFEA